MNWPSSQDYNEAIQNAATSMSDPDLKNGEATVNAIGLPVPRSGNFADVYQFNGADGTMWAVKCFTRQVAGLGERYTKINEYLEKAGLPFTVGFKYLTEGIRIRGQWYPLLKMQWVEGFTLNEFVRQNADKPNYLHGLMQMWAKLTGRLRDANIAHADLQHGNVLLVPGSTPSKLGLKLIDYDGMWVPPLADQHSGEVGHPNFQHPARLKERLFNADVDRYPHLVIGCALRATLVGGKSLWDRFDNGDNLLFREQDLREPEKAPIFQALWDLNDGVVKTLVGHIALSSKQPLRKTPWLDDVLFDEKGPRLSPALESQAVAMLGVSLPVAKAAEVPAQAEFGDFELVDDDDPDDRPRTKRKRRVDDEEEDEDRDKGYRLSADSGVHRRAAKKPKPQEAKKSKLPLFIGAGVAAAALIGVALALALGGKKQKVEPEPEVVQQGPGPKPKDLGGHKDAGSDPGKKGTNPSDIPKKEPKEVKEPKELAQVDNPPSPFVPGASGFIKPVIRVVGVPRSRAFLYLVEGSPHLALVEDGKPYRGLGKQDAPIQALACSPDRARAVTGGDDGQLCVWSLREANALEHALKEHSQQIVACAVSPDSSRAVSIGKDDLLCEWDIVAGKLLQKFKIPASLAVAYLADGKNVVIGTAKDSAAIWDLTKQQRVKELAGHEGAVHAVCVTPDGSKAITGGNDAIIRVWDAVSGSLLHKLEGSKAPILGLAVSPNSRYLAVAIGPQGKSFWDLEQGSFKHGGSNTIMDFRSISFLDDEQSVVCGVALNGGRGQIWGEKTNLWAGKKDPKSVSPKAGVEFTKILGGQPDQTDYLDAAPEGGLLVGLQIALGKFNENDNICAVRPIFRTDGTETMGVQRGIYLFRTLRVLAKPGYAVGAATIKAGPWVDGFSLTFMKVVNGRLNPKDSYESEWVGGQGGGPPEMLGGDGTPVIGIVGKANTTNATGLGLLFKSLNQPKLNAAYTKIAGGGGGKPDYIEAAPEGALLVGFSLGLDKPGVDDAIHSFTPIFRKDGAKETPRGVRRGINPTRVVTPIAKPGYAVGAITVEAGSAVEAISVTYMKVVDGKLDPKDSYTSEFMGFPRNKPRVKLGGNGTPVIGIVGKLNGNDATGIGLLLKGEAKTPDPKLPDLSPAPKGELLTLVGDSKLAGDPLGRTIFRDDGTYFCQINGTKVAVADGEGREIEVFTLPSMVIDAVFGRGSQIYALTVEGQFELLDYSSRKVQHFDGKSQKQNMMKILPTANPEQLLIGGVGAQLIRWNTAAWKEIDHFTPYAKDALCIARSAFPDGNRIILNVADRGGDRHVVWDLAKNKEIVALEKVETTNLFFVEPSPNEKWIVGYRDDGSSGRFFVWDAETGKLAHNVPNIRASRQFIGFASGDTLLFQKVGGALMLLDLKEGKIARQSEIKPPIVHGGISAKAGLAATVDAEGKTRIWRIEAEK